VEGVAVAEAGGHGVGEGLESRGVDGAGAIVEETGELLEHGELADALVEVAEELAAFVVLLMEGGDELAALECEGNEQCGEGGEGEPAEDVPEQVACGSKQEDEEERAEAGG
jgi:hypothetical protein